MNIKFFIASTLFLSACALSSCSDDENYIEAPVDDSQMVLEGKVGDDDAANMVYVDFSKNAQESVSRRSWHLGFYCGEEFRVALNQSLARAYSSKKTDFAAVTLSDAEAAPNLSAGMMGFGELADIVICDDTDHDLSKTVFGDIKADANESEVFFVATEEMPDRATWFKVKVTQKGNAYHVLYGRVSDQEPKELEIVKDATKTFVNLSLNNGKIVEVPDNWDMMWSSAMAMNAMPNGKIIFGPASDVITMNNLNHTETAIIMAEEFGGIENLSQAYDKFTKADLANVEFHKEADYIGTSWRTAPMPGATPGPKFDRFYVIKDGEGNYYKLVFLSFCEEDGGERGRPELIFTAVE